MRAEYCGVRDDDDTECIEPAVGVISCVAVVAGKKYPQIVKICQVHADELELMERTPWTFSPYIVDLTPEEMEQLKEAVNGEAESIG